MPNGMGILSCLNLALISAIRRLSCSSGVTTFTMHLPDLVITQALECGASTTRTPYQTSTGTNATSNLLTVTYVDGLVDSAPKALISLNGPRSLGRKRGPQETGASNRKGCCTNGYADGRPGSCIVADSRYILRGFSQGKKN